MIRLLVAAGLALIASCASAPVHIDGDDDYIITIPLPLESGAVSAGSTKVYFSGNTWDVPLRVRKTVRELMEDYDVRLIDTWPLELIKEFCIVVEASETEIARLAKDTRIESVQKINHFVTLGSVPPYNDDHLSLQLGNNVASLNRLHAWSTGKDVKVGIIDTPIDLSHPDLASRIASQEVFVAGDLDETDYVHGTAIAGIIGARAGNGIGIVGYAPDARLQSFAACHHRDDWDETVCNTFSLAKAIAATGKHDLDVLNMSLSGPEDVLLSRLLSHLMDEGTIVVAPYNPGERNTAFPASDERVVGVRNLNHANSPDTSIRIDDEHLSTRSGGGYQFFYGASMSAARVTALISLLLERNPDMDQMESMRSLAHITENCSVRRAADASCALKFALSTERIAATTGESDD